MIRRPKGLAQRDLDLPNQEERVRSVKQRRAYIAAGMRILLAQGYYDNAAFWNPRQLKIRENGETYRMEVSGAEAMISHLDMPGPNTYDPADAPEYREWLAP